MFCPNLQKLHKLIYDLTRKDRPFIQTKMHQDAFEEMKNRLLISLVLQLSKNGRFLLFSDNRKSATGSALYQIQNGTPKLIGNYSIKELELGGLCANFSQFKHLLTRVDFDCTVHHLALTYILKSKTEPGNVTIKRLLEVLVLSA